MCEWGWERMHTKICLYVETDLNNIGLISSRENDFDGYFNVPRKEKSKVSVGRKPRENR